MRESKGSSREGRVSVFANWPIDTLFVHETGSPSSVEAQSFHPALFEAKICGQDFSNTSGSLARDAAVSQQVHKGSVVLNIHSISDPSNLSNGLPPSPSVSLLWFFDVDQTPSLVANAPSSLFSMDNQLTLLAHNWGLDLCGGVPCNLTREVVRDAIAMSLSSRIHAFDSRLRDTSRAGWA